MKYQTKQAAIEAAQAMGSAAQTYRGAARYLVARAINTVPLYQRGEKRLWSRGPVAATNYICERRGARCARRLGYVWEQGAAYAEADRLNRSICERASDYLATRWPYRRSRSSWAGGGHTISVTIGTPGISGGSLQVWSRNGKWRGTNSYANITTTWETLYLYPTLATPDGLVVVAAREISPREHEITWAEQGRGFGLNPVSGYLIRGRHVRAKNIEAARKKVARIRREAAGKYWAARRLATQAKHIWVSVVDSLAAGNCRAATENYRRELEREIAQGKIGAIRGDILLGLRNDIYTRRAVRVAAQRYA